MSQTEDVPYNVSDFATAEPEKEQDPDQPNKGVLQSVLKYLDEQIKTHNSLDLIEPNAEQIMTAQQQVAVQKQVVAHLRSIRSDISNKIKELV